MRKRYHATGHDLHIDVPLSNIAMNYRPMNMIADMVAPVVDVPKQSDAYIIWSQADAMRVENDKRSPGDEANKIYRSVSSDTFYCENYALKTPLTLEDRENMDAAYVQKLRRGKVQFLKSKIVLSWEKRLADLVTNTSNVGSSSAVSSDWMDYTNGQSDPLSDMWTAIYNVADATGYRPNRCVMGELAWRHFRRHADVIDIIHGNTENRGANEVRYASREQFKKIFEFEEFLVGGAYYNSADKGQSASLSLLWGDNVLVYYAPDAPSIDEPSFMYSMRWAKPAIPNMQAEVHPFDTRKKSEEVELGYYQDEKITASALGFLITNPTSV